MMAHIGYRPPTYLEIKHQRMRELALREQRKKQWFGWLWNLLTPYDPYEKLDNQDLDFVDDLTDDECIELWKLDNPPPPKRLPKPSN
ncbi:hypothetical protein VH441_07400 [Psychrobacter sp. HD31]|uniref:hypothetical protein n=1 Tax=Psychrobacter sp. HD31 TaxID=3112003 RepID=UPI003DA4BEC4